VTGCEETGLKSQEIRVSGSKLRVAGYSVLAFGFQASLLSPVVIPEKSGIQNMPLAYSRWLLLDSRLRGNDVSGHELWDTGINLFKGDNFYSGPDHHFVFL